MMSKTKQTCFVFFVIALTTLCCLTSTSDAFSPAQANMRGSVKPIVNIPKSKVDRPRVQPIAPRKPGAPPSAFHPGRNNNGNLPAMSMESNNNNKNNNMGMESLVMQESEVEKKWKATMPDFSDLFGEKKTPDFKIPSGKEFMTAAIAAGVVMGEPASALAVPVDGKVLTPIEQLQEPPSQYVPRPREIKYNDLVDKTVRNELTAARFTGDGKSVTVLDVNGKRFSVAALEFDPNLLNVMEEHNVDTLVATGTQAKGDNVILNALSNFIVPGFILLGVFALLRRNAAGGGMGGPNPFQMGKSVAKIQMEPDTNTNFEDVAGCDEAKEELVEVVDFLKNTEKYAKLGATIPRGVILEGSPGTGKTLLARAVAGEAGVPFFSVSGSEFVEMFVGVGASRVRDLFKQAKENAPCIIFIDEIDAVGRQRSAGGGMMGGNDEREQTLNQILTEMDGFEGNAGVVVMAATNRADVLDAALLRPGRFDRRVGVNLADFAGRVAILKVHARNKPFAPDVDLEGVARRTVGFSGAQLQNLLNEAAIYAARDGAKEITYKNIDDALDRLLVGLAKKNRDAQPLETKRLVALHEAGHAIVGALTPGYDDVQKVTIIPRSNGAGGLTFFAPSEDRVDSGLYSRIYLEGAIAVALGGRVAEELFYDKGGVTTGASSDLQQVASTARNMVTQWGMTNVIPPLATGAQQGQPEAAGQWSTEVQEAIDEEIFKIVNNAYATARGILVDHEHLVRELADKLIEKETVDEFEVKELVKDDIEKMNKERYRAYRETSMPVIKTLPSAMEEIEKIEEENRYKSIIELNNLLTPENIEKAKQFVSAEDIAALEELTQTE